MKIWQAKEYFGDGMITGFTALRDPLVPDNWILQIHGRGGKTWLFETAINETRSFARLDTLVGTVADISGRVTSCVLHV